MRRLGGKLPSCVVLIAMALAPGSMDRAPAQERGGQRATEGHGRARSGPRPRRGRGHRGPQRAMEGQVLGQGFEPEATAHGRGEVWWGVVRCRRHLHSAYV